MPIVVAQKSNPEEPLGGYLLLTSHDGCIAGLAAQDFLPISLSFSNDSVKIRRISSLELAQVKLLEKISERLSLL